MTHDPDIRSTGRSSSWFGPCEICARHCSEVHKRTVGAHPGGIPDLVFGHAQCLAKPGDLRAVARTFRRAYHRLGLEGHELQQYMADKQAELCR